MTFEDRTSQRITADFSADDRDMVTGMLELYAGPEAERVLWDILELSHGDVALVMKYVGMANTDYRDVLYWAEFYSKDPLVQGREAKEIVSEILEKFGPDADGGA